MVGYGYEYKKAQKFQKDHQLKNVDILGKVDYDQLNNKINEADVCLGIFGDTKKSNFSI